MYIHKCYERYTPRAMIDAIGPDPNPLRQWQTSKRWQVVFQMSKATVSKATMTSCLSNVSGSGSVHNNKIDKLSASLPGEQWSERTGS